jgi:hypothetical protein
MAATTKDLLTEALGRVTEQLRGKPDFETLVSLLTTQMTALQAALLSILDDTVIDDSEGAQLDGVGAIVGEERFGRDDITYRTFLKARIRLNLSNGTIEDVISLIEAILGGLFTVKLTEYQPAAFIAEVLEGIDPNVINPAQVGALVRSGRAAGVGSGTVFHVDPGFQYDGAAGHGFDDGKYADIF